MIPGDRGLNSRERGLSLVGLGDGGEEDGVLRTEARQREIPISVALRR